jgi:hypothetical protein
MRLNLPIFSDPSLLLVVDTHYSYGVLILLYSEY